MLPTNRYGANNCNRVAKCNKCAVERNSSICPLIIRLDLLQMVKCQIISLNALIVAVTIRLPSVDIQNDPCRMYQNKSLNVQQLSKRKK